MICEVVQDALLPLQTTINKKMKYRYTLLIALMSLCLTALDSQQIQKASKTNVLLTNATVHTITNGVMEGTDVFIKDGIIADIGKSLSPSDHLHKIDCSALHIYPGFMDGGTQLGMSEVGAVSLTNDYNEIGDMIPHMKALTAVNPNAVAIPVTRVNGVTNAMVVPSGGLFPGTAAFINLHGYTPQQMASGFEGIVLNFPSSSHFGRWDRRSEEDIKKEQKKAMKKLNDIWSELALYHKIDSSAQRSGTTIKSYEPEMKALLPAYRGEMTILIHTNKDKDILSALQWIKKTGVKAILVGVSEGYRIADSIAQANVPVITGPVQSVPGRGAARYDVAYRNASILHNAGVKVALRTNDSENVRNLPFHAGFAATYGLGVEEALKTLTINLAEMLGIADRYGSIEQGKVANLFVSDGDPFEMKTRIKHLFINGWNIPIESRHTLLYNEFLERSPGLKK